MGVLGTGHGSYGVSMGSGAFKNRKDKSASIEVYDHKGWIVSPDMLKKHDVLIVFFRDPSEGSISTEVLITQRVQGTDYHMSLIVFERLNEDGLCGWQASWFTGLDKPLFFPWDNIERIQIAGNDPTGRTLSFGKELFRQKARAERAAEKMRANIDALKA